MNKFKPFAKKSFGQNFLVDEKYINKIISAINPEKDENIVEIGAGRGALTEKLVESEANIIAIEFEREMISVLKGKFGNYQKFMLVESDALKVDFAKLIENKSANTKLVANLPYNIATAILQKLIEQRAVFSEMVLMFQREVVDRIIAKEGTSERGFLSVLSQKYLETEKLFDVPPTAFRPSPKIWSAVVRLKPKIINVENEILFREIIATGFSQRRKTILNNLKLKFPTAEIILGECEIDSKRRAETLSVEEWNKIYEKSRTPKN